MANLYTPYDLGTFENSFQAAFTFNGSGPVNCGTFDMSNEYVIQGSKSARLIASADAIKSAGFKYAQSGFAFRARPGSGMFNIISLTANNYYEIKANVITPSGNPIADDDAMIFLVGDLNDLYPATGGVNGITITDLGGGKYKLIKIDPTNGNLEIIGYKISAIKDSLKELSYIWRESASNFSFTVPRLVIVLNNPAGNVLPIIGDQNLLVGGRIFFDEMNLEPPTPPCTLTFSNPAYIKTDETGVGLNDGTIQVLATGQGTLQYKLDAGSYQFSNSFSGIAPGIHSVTVKDSSICTPITTNITILQFNVIPPPPPPPPPPSGTLLIDEKPVNQNNFINWFPAIGDTGFTSIDCFNENWDLPKAYRLINKGYNHYSVIAHAEDFSFYINFDSPINDPDFSLFRIALISEQGVIIPSIGILKRDLFPDGVTYNIYAENLNVSAIAPEGFYKLLIYREDTGVTYFISSDIQVMTPDNAKDYTCRIIHRNSNDVYNYYYTRVPEYLNKIRLKMNVIEEQSEATVQQYRAASSGKLRNASFELDKFMKFETYYFDDLAIRGMYVFQMSDTININEKNFILKEPYKTQWNVKLNINKGVIELYEQEFSTANRFGRPGNITIIGSDDPLLLGDSGGRIKL